MHLFIYALSMDPTLLWQPVLLKHFPQVAQLAGQAVSLATEQEGPPAAVQPLPQALGGPAHLHRQNSGGQSPWGRSRPPQTYSEVLFFYPEISQEWCILLP